MIEKQKAKELIEKFIDLLPYSNRVYETAKQFALISMNEKIGYAKTFGDVTIGDIQEFERIKVEIQNYEP
jgi:hypothetical protein